jgi:ABC-type antimicrobial peptide transport system permease subunit
MVGMLLALLIGRLASLSVPFAAALLVLPVAVSLALAAGVLPAWKASRGMPLDAVRPPVSAGGRRRRVRGMRSLALVNVTRVRGRFLVAVGGLVVGVAALTLLVAVERAFRGSVVGTVLGNALSVQVRGADFLAVGITIALAALSVADVLYINLRERAPELASLRTVGWSDHQLGLLVALEATVIGLTGSVIGAALGVSVSVLAFDTPLAPLVAAAGLSILGGVTAALAASLVPVAQLRRLAPVAVLATE